jgi:hypothetical protein
MTSATAVMIRRAIWRLTPNHLLFHPIHPPRSLSSLHHNHSRPLPHLPLHLRLHPSHSNSNSHLSPNFRLGHRPNPVNPRKHIISPPDATTATATVNFPYALSGHACPFPPPGPDPSFCPVDALPRRTPRLPCSATAGTGCPFYASTPAPPLPSQIAAVHTAASPAPGVLRSPFNVMQMHHIPHPHAHARHHHTRLNIAEGLYGPDGGSQSGRT